MMSKIQKPILCLRFQFILRLWKRLLLAVVVVWLWLSHVAPPVAPPRSVLSVLYLSDLRSNIYVLSGIWSCVQHQADLCSNVCV